MLTGMAGASMAGQSEVARTSWGSILSSWTQSFCRFRLQLPAVASEAVFDRRAEARSRGVAPHRDLLVLDLPEHRLDLVQLGTVGRQEVQVDPRVGQPLAGPPDDFTGMEARVVQDYDTRDLRPRQGLQEPEQVVRVPGPLRCEHLQPGR